MRQKGKEDSVADFFSRHRARGSIEIYCRWRGGGFQVCCLEVIRADVLSRTGLPFTRDRTMMSRGFFGGSEGQHQQFCTSNQFPRYSKCFTYSGTRAAICSPFTSNKQQGFHEKEESFPTVQPPGKKKSQQKKRTRMNVWKEVPVVEAGFMGSGP